MACNCITLTCHFCLSSQMNWGYNFCLYFFKTRINILLPSMLWSSTLSLHSTFSNPCVCNLKSSMEATCYMHLAVHDWIFTITLGKGLWSTQLHIFPSLSRLLSLITKYSPQHSITRHPQSMLFHQYNRSSFKPIETNMQNYCFAHFLSSHLLFADGNSKNSKLTAARNLQLQCVF
jgi:hypothetical protein